MTRCCVHKCTKTGIHRFPQDDQVRKKWLKAIRRTDFVITNSSRLCPNHFLETDYQGFSRDTGLLHQHKHLRKGAVPSRFAWNYKPATEASKQRQERLYVRNCKKSLVYPDNETATSSDNPNFLPLVGDEQVVVAHEVEIDLPDTTPNENIVHLTLCHTSSTQTPALWSLFSTDFLMSDDESVRFYTGLENINKFHLVLSTLLPEGNHLKYRWNQVNNVSIEDQFMMLLIKLRRNKTDFELSKMFKVSGTTVSNIIVTWINFVHDMWRLIDIWPTKELVNYYMPDKFRQKFPATRVIVDGTEIPIQKPSQPKVQKATFSSYKHKNTMKVLVGSTPGGLLSYCSEAYAGSTSDRQIVERSNLLHMCEEGDSIMADRGFNVQDLFASQGIGVNIPTFLKGKTQIPGLLTKTDQNLASQRVHIERLIGLTKTYIILKHELNHFYTPLSSKIFFICLMLCNFREAIVKK